MVGGLPSRKPPSPAPQPQPAAQPAPQQPEPAPQPQARVPRIRVKCPRCGRWGRLYSDERGYREYVYVKHSADNICYLGPADGYAVVQALHGYLALTNLRAIDYADVIAYAAEKLFQRLEKDGKKDEAEIMEGIITMAEVIRDACNKLDRAVCLEKVMRTLLL